VVYAAAAEACRTGLPVANPPLARGAAGVGAGLEAGMAFIKSGPLSAALVAAAVFRRSPRLAELPLRLEQPLGVGLRSAAVEEGRGQGSS
jgi:hypothetical protein